MVTTANDLMTWLQSNMGIIAVQPLNTILPVVQTGVAGVSIPGSTTVPGLGWFVSKLQGSASNLTIVQKNGDLPGFCSQMSFLAPDGCSNSAAGAFAVVNYHDASSSAPTSPATKIVNDLLLALTNQQAPN